MRAHRHEFGILPRTLLAKSHEKPPMRASQKLVRAALVDASDVYAQLRTRPEGLTSSEAEARLAEHGQNILAKDQRPSFLRLLWRAIRNPLVVLLGVLASVSFATGDPRAATMMLMMIALSVVLRLVQESKASRAAAKLKALISVKATVLRDGAPEEVAVSHLVTGDVVQLAAGDMIPGDVRIVSAKDLFVVQSSLTGETFPVEKFAVETMNNSSSPLELKSIAFLGTSVASGSATAVVAATGKETYLGGMAEALQEEAPPTAFDRGIARFTTLMLGFMAVMVPTVFLINGLTKGSWAEAFFFAVAVAVGLTPEMLPMIVTICLSQGAIAMGKKKVIVKRINAIQNLGAMDVLCTDKTGTLTRDEIILERRREPAHADTHHPRHPHQQAAVHRESVVQLSAGDELADHGIRRGIAVLAARSLHRVHAAPVVVLAVPRADVVLLRSAHASCEILAAATRLGLKLSTRMPRARVRIPRGAARRRYSRGRDPC